MKKFFPVLLTLFLLLLIGGNLFLLYLLGQGIWGQRIVRVDTMPEWQKMTSHLPEDLHNGKVYKIKDPDAALFLIRKIRESSFMWTGQDTFSGFITRQMK